MALVECSSSSTSTSTTSAVPSPVSTDVERVQAADDDARLADVVDVHDRRVLEDRPLGDELAVLGLDRGDLHGHAGVQAGGQAGADLEAEQAAAEQRVGVALVAG